MGAVTKATWTAGGRSRVTRASVTVAGGQPHRPSTALALIFEKSWTISGVARLSCPAVGTSQSSLPLGPAAPSPSSALFPSVLHQHGRPNYEGSKNRAPDEYRRPTSRHRSPPPLVTLLDKCSLSPVPGPARLRWSPTRFQMVSRRSSRSMQRCGSRRNCRTVETRISRMFMWLPTGIETQITTEGSVDCSIPRSPRRKCSRRASTAGFWGSNDHERLDEDSSQA